MIQENDIVDAGQILARILADPDADRESRVYQLVHDAQNNLFGALMRHQAEQLDSPAPHN